MQSVNNKNYWHHCCKVWSNKVVYCRFNAVKDRFRTAFNTYKLHTLFPVCQRLGDLHQRSENQWPEGVDEPHEEDHPDCRGSGRPVRTVEGPQWDRRSEYTSTSANTVLQTEVALKLQGQTLTCSFYGDVNVTPPHSGCVWGANLRGDSGEFPRGVCTQRPGQVSLSLPQGWGKGSSWRCFFFFPSNH